MVHGALFGITVCHCHMPSAHTSVTRLHTIAPFTMPSPLNTTFSQGLSRIINYGQDIMSRIVMTPTYVWAHSIVIEVGIELLE